MVDRKRSSRDRGYSDEEYDRDRYDSKRRRGTCIIKLLCPYYVAGAVIGKGGERIREVKDRSGATIEISRHDARFPGTDDRVIALEGEKDELASAARYLNENMREGDQSLNRHDYESERRRKACKILVSDSAMAMIIGRGGDNIRDIKREFAVQINTSKRSETPRELDERIVTIEGEDRDIDRCMDELVNQICTDDRSKMRFYVDYSEIRFFRRKGNDRDERGGRGRGGDRGGDRGWGEPSRSRKSRSRSRGRRSRSKRSPSYGRRSPSFDRRRSPGRRRSPSPRRRSPSPRRRSPSPRRRSPSPKRRKSRSSRSSSRGKRRSASPKRKSSSPRRKITPSRSRSRSTKRSRSPKRKTKSRSSSSSRKSKSPELKREKVSRSPSRSRSPAVKAKKDRESKTPEVKQERISRSRSGSPASNRSVSPAKSDSSRSSSSKS